MISFQMLRPALLSALFPYTTLFRSRVTTPQAGEAESAIELYLAAHAREAAQSRAPRITVTWDNAEILEVVAGFAAFSGCTIVVSNGCVGKVSAEIKRHPCDLACLAV